MRIHGTVAEGWEPVREAFRRNFTDLGERGAAVSVQRDGRTVVDLWAGARDADAGAGGAPWEQDTAQVVRSATKGVTAAVLLLLHQRGQLALDTPVAEVWPEFRTHGKERIRVRDLLAHRGGLPVLDRPLTPAEACGDFSVGAAAVAAQAPAWEPGTAHGYHPHTFAWLTGELIRRTTGQDAGAWIAAELAAPLGLDLWLGLPADQTHRVGRVGPVPPPPGHPGLRTRPKRAVAEAYADPGSLTRRAFGAISPAPDENSPAFRAAVLPSGNGIATAAALARFYAALIGPTERGGPGGAPVGPLFEPATLAAARAEESTGLDRVLVVPTRFGLGYMLHGSASPLLAPGSFGHPGRGGSLAFADPETALAFAYITNGHRQSVTADPRAQALVRAVRSVL
ncbi:serine hydrolase domain-containing protein [Streptomyces sp. NPDC058045]|uniref:serine hydrolase domain-containing protein n=1 Tax=Streptomyces sp. NPDC058045 TaxID=3346311 RepID=UPI0036EDF559